MLSSEVSLEFLGVAYPYRFFQIKKNVDFSTLLLSFLVSVPMVSDTLSVLQFLLPLISSRLTLLSIHSQQSLINFLAPFKNFPAPPLKLFNTLEKLFSKCHNPDMFFSVHVHSQVTTNTNPSVTCAIVQIVGYLLTGLQNAGSGRNRAGSAFSFQDVWLAGIRERLGDGLAS